MAKLGKPWQHIHAKRAGMQQLEGIALPHNAKQRKVRKIYFGMGK